MGQLAAIVICCALVAFTAADLRKKVPPEVMELIDELHKVCREESGVDQAIVDKIHGGDFTDDGNLKCYFKCMMMQLQAMNDDGDLDMQHIKANIPDEMKEHGALDVLRKCQHITHDDKCEKAFQLIQCFHKANAELSEMFER